MPCKGKGCDCGSEFTGTFCQDNVLQWRYAPMVFCVKHQSRICCAYSANKTGPRALIFANLSTDVSPTICAALTTATKGVSQTGKGTSQLRRLRKIFPTAVCVIRVATVIRLLRLLNGAHRIQQHQSYPSSRSKQFCVSVCRRPAGAHAWKEHLFQRTPRRAASKQPMRQTSSKSALAVFVQCAHQDQSVYCFILYTCSLGPLSVPCQRCTGSETVALHVDIANRLIAVKLIRSPKW
jgi:hypothetical protein